MASLASVGNVSMANDPARMPNSGRMMYSYAISILASRVGAYDDVFGWTADVRAVFTGHTHRVTMTPFRGGRGYQYEVGCSTFLPPYALDHARGGPWSEIRMACGYGLAVFDADGRIDLTESRAVHLGWARLPR